jgi:ribonuclease-3
MDEAILQRAEDLLEYDFEDRAVLNRALTHSSIAESRKESNERLEFLGDSVLGLVVCEHLHRKRHDQGQVIRCKPACVR